MALTYFHDVLLGKKKCYKIYDPSITLKNMNIHMYN